MEQLIAVIGILIAVVITVKTLMPSSSPTYGTTEMISDYGIFRNAAQLGKRCKTYESGGAINYRAEIRTIKRAFKATLSHNSELDSVQILLAKNSDLISEIIDKTKKFLRRGYLLQRVNGMPRIFMLCREVAMSTQGCVEISTFLSAVESFNAHAELSYNELSSLPNMMTYCLLGLLASEIKLHERRNNAFMRGVKDGKLNKIDIDSVNINDYMCGVYATVGEHERTMINKITSEYGEVRADTAKYRMEHAKSEALISSIIKSVVRMQNADIDGFIKIGKAFRLLSACRSFSCCDSVTKRYYLNIIGNRARARNVTDSIIATRAVDKVDLTGSDIAEIILPNKIYDVLSLLRFAIPIIMAIVPIVLAIVFRQYYWLLALPIFFYAVLLLFDTLIVSHFDKKVLPRVNIEELPRKCAIVCYYVHAKHSGDITSASKNLQVLKAINNSYDFDYGLLIDNSAKCCSESEINYAIEHGINAYVLNSEENNTIKADAIYKLYRLFAYGDTIGFSTCSQNQYGYMIMLENGAMLQNAAELLCTAAHPNCKNAALLLIENGKQLFGKLNIGKLGLFESIYETGYNRRGFSSGIIRISKNNSSYLYSREESGYSVFSEVTHEFTHYIRSYAERIRDTIKLIPHVFKRKNTDISPNSSERASIICDSILMFTPLALLSAAIIISVNSAVYLIIVVYTLPIIGVAIALRNAIVEFSLKPLCGVARAICGFCLLPTFVTVLLSVLVLSVYKSVRHGMLGLDFMLPNAVFICVLQALFGCTAFALSFYFNAMSGIPVSVLFLLGAMLPFLHRFNNKFIPKHKKELTSILRASCKYFEQARAKNGDVLDKFDYDGGWSEQTSPVSIGFAAVALVCEKKFGFIDDDSFIRRVENIIAALKAAPKCKGHLLVRRSGSAQAVQYISTEQSGNLALMLYMLSETVNAEQKARIIEIADGMDFEFLISDDGFLYSAYYPSEHRYTESGSRAASIAATIIALGRGADLKCDNRALCAQYSAADYLFSGLFLHDYMHSNKYRNFVKSQMQTVSNRENTKFFSGYEIILPFATALCMRYKSAAGDFCKFAANRRGVYGLKDGVEDDLTDAFSAFTQGITVAGITEYIFGDYLQSLLCRNVKIKAGIFKLFYAHNDIAVLSENQSDGVNKVASDELYVAFGGEPDYKVNLLSGANLRMITDNRGKIVLYRNGTKIIGDKSDSFLIEAECDGNIISLRNCSGKFYPYKTQYSSVSADLVLTFDLVPQSDTECILMNISALNCSDTMKRVKFSIVIIPNSEYCTKLGTVRVNNGVVAERNGTRVLGLAFSCNAKYLSSRSEFYGLQKEFGTKADSALCAVIDCNIDAGESFNFSGAIIDADSILRFNNFTALVGSGGYYSAKLAEAMALNNEFKYENALGAKLLSCNFDCDANVCDPHLPTMVYSLNDDNYSDVLTDAAKDAKLLEFGIAFNAVFADFRKHDLRTDKIFAIYADCKPIILKDATLIARAKNIAVNMQAEPPVDNIVQQPLTETVFKQPNAEYDWGEFDYYLPQCYGGVLADGSIVMELRKSIGALQWRHPIVGKDSGVVLTQSGGERYYGGVLKKLNYIDDDIIAESYANIVISDDKYLWYAIPQNRCNNAIVKFGFGVIEYHCYGHDCKTTVKRYMTGNNLFVAELSLENLAQSNRQLNILFSFLAAQVSPCNIYKIGDKLICESKIDGCGIELYSSEAIDDYTFYEEGYTMFGNIVKTSKLGKRGNTVAPTVSLRCKLLPKEKKTIKYFISAFLKKSSILVDKAELAEANLYNDFPLAISSSDRALNVQYMWALYTANAHMSSTLNECNIYGENLSDMLYGCFAVKYVNLIAVRSQIMAFCKRVVSSDENIGDVKDLTILPIVVSDYIEFCGGREILYERVTCSVSGENLTVMQICKHIMFSCYKLLRSDQQSERFALLLAINMTARFFPQNECRKLFEIAREIRSDAMNDLLWQADNDRAIALAAAVGIINGTAAICALNAAEDRILNKAKSGSILTALIYAFARYKFGDGDKAYSAMRCINPFDDKIRNASYAPHILIDKSEPYVTRFCGGIYYALVTERLLGIKQRGAVLTFSPNVPQGMTVRYQILIGKKPLTVVVDNTESKGEWHIKHGNITYATNTVKVSDSMYLSPIILFKSGKSI